MKKWIMDNRGFIIFLIGFAFLRTAIADWNPIPSGSMRPNLLEGDVVLVNRAAYDFKLPLTDVIVAHIADPKRGDIVVFASPKNGMKLIKRLVALPGDRVEMRKEVLFINGKPATYSDQEVLREPLDNGGTIEALRVTESIGQHQRRVQFLAGVSAKNTFGPIVVPEDNFMMLGDNRDNSADSRYIGFVPRHLLSGQAHHILLSADILGNWHPRTERFGQHL
jgi:signal peptidase I